MQDHNALVNDTNKTNAQGICPEINEEFEQREQSGIRQQFKDMAAQESSVPLMNYLLDCARKNKLTDAEIDLLTQQFIS